LLSELNVAILRLARRLRKRIPPLKAWRMPRKQKNLPV